MRSTNHFVIRNGKVVSKVQAQKLPQTPSTHLHVIKPSTIIIKHADKQPQEDQLSKIKKYYDGIIKKYQEKIKQLQKELTEKNQIIEKQSRTLVTECQSCYHTKNCQQSRFSGRGLFQQQNKQNLFASIEKLKIQEFQLKNSVVQIIQNPLNSQNQKQQGSNLHTGPSYEQIDSANKISSEDLTSSCPQYPNSQKLSSISSMTSLNSVCSVPLFEKAGHIQSKAFFDTSTLMDRLNRSASLVKNIKKFLQPSTMQQIDQQQQSNSPKSKKTSSPHQSKSNNNQQCEKKCKSQESQSSQLSSSEGSQVECELQKFIDELIQKHQQILLLAQQLQLEKQVQVRQIKQHYQEIINKIQFQRTAHSHIKHSHHSFGHHHSRVALKSWSENKQNSKLATIESLEKSGQCAKQKQMSKTQMKPYLSHDYERDNNSEIDVAVTESNNEDTQVEEEIF